MSEQNIPISAPGGLAPGLRGQTVGFAGRPQFSDFEAVNDEESFDPLRLFYFVLQYRWMIGILLVIGLAAGFVFTKAQTPQYQASSRLEILVPSARVFQDIEVVSESKDMRAFLTARERLTSRTLAQHVVLSLGLADNRAFLFPPPSFSLDNILRRAFHLESSTRLEDFTPEERMSIAVDRVRRNMSVNLINSTSILGITFKDPNPRIARMIADQIAQSYIDQRVDQIGATSELARQFIEDQVAQVKAKLQTSEQALVDYAKQAGIAVTGTDQSLIDSSIQAINGALSEAIKDRLKYEAQAKQISNGRGGSLEEALRSEGLQRLRSDIASLNAEYQQKLRVYKPGFPEMQQLQAQITEMRRQYEDGIALIVDGIQLRLEEASVREADLRAQLVNLQAEQVAFQDKNIQYSILKRELDSNRIQYESLIGKMNEVGVASELRTKNATIVDNAVLPGAPVSPRMPINLALGAILSLFTSAVVIYVREKLSNTFVSPDQVEKTLSLPVLGLLPYVDEQQRAEIADNPKSELSEAYRSLRTSIQFASGEGPLGTFLITSSVPFEGKSTTVFKLAQDFAQLNKKVVVIDGDLRKPKVHRLFGLDNTLGLSDILLHGDGNENVTRLIRQTGMEGVWTITSGTIPSNPADLLASQRMAALIDSLLQRFDVVLIDAPPVLGLADAPILARLARNTLLIVSTNQVTRNTAIGALKRLRAAGANVIGAAMSKFTASKFDYSYSYRYMSQVYYSYGNDALQLEGRDEGKKPRKQSSNWLSLRALGLGRNSAAGGDRNRSR
ncbi:MAG: GumC family protein [Pseudochelatococcus sp.]|jgi:succinoglycan biosynthesis transport protein ExoP|uniref:GumC family protein n=1 Tax=Pseudochelatococcus sp. TaxID=2020869 RepID=UPI003D8EC1A4